MGLYRRRLYTRRTKKRLFVFTTFFILLLITYICCLLMSRVHSVFAIRADAFANGIATQAVNLATQDYMSTHNISVQSFSSIQTDDNKRPMSIESDTGMMNSFRADITERIAYYVEKNMYGTIYIPLGSLFGNDLFNGVGFNLPVKVAPSDIVDVDFEDEFTSVGINQVKHSVFLKARINVSVMTSAMCVSEDVYVTFPMADTVIMGDVPNYYGKDLNVAATVEKTN
jgi:sporulation protein YunB